MKLYLIQHGDAVAKERNADRPLSEKGVADAQRLAVLMARSRPDVTRIIHSNKTRARETARHLSDVLGPDLSVEEAVSGLAPNDSTDLIFEAIGQWTENVVIVGHLPFLGRLLSRLMTQMTTGTEDAQLVDFVPGTAVCLERKAADGPWIISSVLGPGVMGR